MRKNSVNKSAYSKGFLAMIRDNFDVAVATDIIGKSRKIKAILTEKKEAYLLVTILQKSAFLHF